MNIKTFKTNAFFGFLTFSVSLCHAQFFQFFCRGECVDFEFDSEYDQEWQFFPAQPYLSEAVENLIQPLLPPLPLITNPNEEDRVQLLSPNPNRNESQTTKKPSTNEEDDDDEEEEEPSNEEEDGDSDNEDRNSKRNDRKVLGVTDKLVVIPINEG